MNFVFDTGSLIQLDHAFEVAPDIVHREIREFLHAATQYLEGEVVDRTPAAEGKLRSSINADVEEAGIEMLGIVGTSISYAVPVELGTKPHMMPIEPLIQWVRVKLGLEEKQAKSAARAIQYKIAHYGTPGAGMFHRGFTAGRAAVEARFSLAVERIAAGIAKAAT